ncbi:hypothetical protein IW262DRAFT_1389968 [Armillaria fumosa]|nr:hypothetical protein IW262DRAFT_1389968 [Armillaria fumosa]
MSEENFAKVLEHLSGPTTITHLSLRHCVFLSQNHLIQAMSSIKSLDAVNLWCPILRIIPKRCDKTQSPISTLPASVSSLTIYIDSAEDIIWMARIISVTGRSLKRLNIELWPRMVTWDRSMDEFYSALNFDCHPNLEIIAFDSLSLGTRGDGLDRRMKTRHIPAILRKITTSSIREVVLNLASGNSRIKDLDDLDSLDWASISDILRQENYSKLKEITILRVNSDLLDEAMDIIMDGMKGLLETNPLVDLVLSSSRRPVMIPLFGW